MMVLTGCSAIPVDVPTETISPTIADVETPVPTASETPAVTTLPTVTPLPPTPTIPPEWLQVAPGLELRSMTMPLADGKSAEVVLTRIDPAFNDVRVHYDPAAPANVGEWRERLGALVVINGGFFQEDNTTAGLIITEGNAQGTSFDAIEARYYEFGGMLAINDGMPSLRYLAHSPYQRGEALDYAVQGLPMLIDPSTGPIAFDLPDRAARRTAVALDSSGRLILITVSNSAITLYDLRDWLVSNSELAITAALGLDGGPSTGLAVNTPAMQFSQNSWSEVPSVIAIYPRQ